jgi:hypothetical protein
MRSGKFATLVTPDESSNIFITSKCSKEEAYDLQQWGFTLCEENPCHRRFIVHHEEIRVVSIIRVNNTVTSSIRVLVIVKGCMNKTKVHVELGTGLMHFASLSMCSALTDPSLHFPVYVSERVEFE